MILDFTCRCLLRLLIGRPLMQNFLPQPLQFLDGALFCFISSIYVAGRSLNNIQNLLEPLPEMGMVLQPFFKAGLMRCGHGFLRVD